MHRQDEEMQRFLDEDYGRGDITSDLLVPKELEANGEIRVKEDAVIAGIEEVSALFKRVGLNQQWKAVDGNTARSGDVLVEVSGKARTILSVERVALNILSHMSGVATATRRAVDIVSAINSSVRIAGTRKTLPGLRVMEKRAIKLGGGDPHRTDLHDMILIKDNHLTLTGTVSSALRKIRKTKPKGKGVIEVEVGTPEAALEAARSLADIIMLDNMSVKDVMDAVSQLEKNELREKVLLEVSGGIGFSHLENYAKTGIDMISMGILTNSSAAVD
ncbi:MAG: carboxylating nicotinate-nucleotide diphosphorylase, partial [Nitrososphaerales archaeon]